MCLSRAGNNVGVAICVSMAPSPLFSSSTLVPRRARHFGKLCIARNDCNTTISTVECLQASFYDYNVRGCLHNSNCKQSRPRASPMQRPTFRTFSTGLVRYHRALSLHSSMTSISISCSSYTQRRNTIDRIAWLWRALSLYPRSIALQALFEI